MLDLTGMRFGRLAVLSLADRLPKTNVWLCKCDCGNTHCVRQSNLRSGSVRSCGCLMRELSGARLRTHGASTKRTPEYISWCQMIQRCEDPNATGYERWGGAGVTVCGRWRHDFPAFLADMGPRPVGMSLDRYPNNKGNYEPSNCRWATRREQLLNRTLTDEQRAAMRERGLRIGAIGRQGAAKSAEVRRAKGFCVAAAARAAGIKKNTVLSRLKMGWSMEEALRLPPSRLARANRPVPEAQTP